MKQTDLIEKQRLETRHQIIRTFEKRGKTLVLCVHLQHGSLCFDITRATSKG